MTRLSRAAVIAALLIAVLAGGVLAYFTAAGHTDASAAVGNVADITLSAGTPSSALYPGSSADIAVLVSNPNASSVHLPSLVLDGGGITVDAGHSGCDTAKVHYSAQGAYDLPAGTHQLDLAGVVSMDADAASACQGATFTVHLKAGT